MKTPRKMEMSELRQLHARGLGSRELILDVREPDEFAEGHVPGARNIPLDELPARWRELQSYEQIYVHCGGGGRAGRACELLCAQGLGGVVHIFNSGMRSWVAAGFPTEK